MFVFVEFHFEFDSKKSGAQDKIRDKVWIGTPSDDIFQDINFIPYSYHNIKSLVEVNQAIFAWSLFITSVKESIIIKYYKLLSTTV